VRIKNYTVRMNNIHSRLTWAIFRIDEEVRDFLSYDPVITSANDGRHKRSSAHYRGMAVDLRTFDKDGEQLPPDERSRLADLISDLLGEDFDVVPESDHIHVEYDPKVPT